MESNNNHQNKQPERSSWESEDQRMDSNDSTSKNMSSKNREGNDTDPQSGSSLQEQGMGGRGNGMNDATMSSDNYAGHDREDISDSRNMESRTFNEDEDKWEEQQRMGNSAGNSGAGIDYNAPGDNNWDEYDQMHRNTKRNDDSENRNNSRH